MGKLVNVTINLPKVYLEKIDNLKTRGWNISRSEVIRLALREFLIREFSFVRVFSPDFENPLERELESENL